MKRALRYWPFATAVTAWLCILQALYYPFLAEPGWARWWQVGPMAGFGYIFGLPVFLVWESYFKALPFATAWFWALSAGYVFLISVAVRWCVGRLAKSAGAQ